MSCCWRQVPRRGGHEGGISSCPHNQNITCSMPFLVAGSSNSEIRHSMLHRSLRSCSDLRDATNNWSWQRDAAMFHRDRFSCAAFDRMDKLLSRDRTVNLRLCDCPPYKSFMLCLPLLPAAFNSFLFRLTSSFVAGRLIGSSFLPLETRA